MPSIRLLLIVFFVALGLRLGYFLLIRGGPLGNADWPAYEDLGHKLLNHQSYMTSQAGGPGVFPTDLERPPGYPFFLSLVDRLIGPSRQGTAAVQCVLNALLAVALAILVAFFTNKSAGFMAGLFYATDWVTIIHVPLTWRGKLATREYRGVRMLLISPVILLLLPAASAMGQSRFRAPAMVPLCILAGTGGGFLLDERFKRRKEYVLPR